VAVPRSASPFARAVMNGCVIPAPAPCASTQHARASRGAWSRPETRCASLTGMVTGCGSVEFIDANSNLDHTQANGRTIPCHQIRWSVMRGGGSLQTTATLNALAHSSNRPGWQTEDCTFDSDE